MIVRPYRSQDAQAIDEIYERCGHNHDRPNLEKIIGSVVIEYDGVIVAYGYLEQMAIASIILDLEVSNRVKVEALRECLDAGFLCARLNNFEKVYAFIAKDGFENILQRHFDFEPAAPLLKREV